MKRRDSVMALLALSLGRSMAHAQQTGKMWRIGFLDFSSRKSTLDSGRYGAMIDGLRAVGYVEGKNYVLEARYAEGNAERLEPLAVELVRAKMDVILAYGVAASRAAQRATPTIPIVVITTADPVRDGFADSLARPSGNLTGMSNGVGETIQKLLEMLILAVPKLAKVSVITNPANGGHPPLLLRVQAAAQQSGKLVFPYGAGTISDIDRSFAAMAREKVDAVIIIVDAFLFQQRLQIAELALKYRLPSIYAPGGFAEAGGLMSYGADISDNFRRTGAFVDRIFKGAKAGDIPFEQPTRYSLVINRKTANNLGIKLSPELLARVDKVID